MLPAFLLPMLFGGGLGAIMSPDNPIMGALMGGAGGGVLGPSLLGGAGAMGMGATPSGIGAGLGGAEGVGFGLTPQGPMLGASNMGAGLGMGAGGMNPMKILELMSKFKGGQQEQQPQDMSLIQPPTFETPQLSSYTIDRFKNPETYSRRNQEAQRLLTQLLTGGGI